MMGMGKPSLGEIERLVSQLMLPFHAVERNAVLPLKKRRFENDVEHSWSVAFLACNLAPLEAGIMKAMWDAHPEYFARVER
jgi:HD superfamily phosphodiesterase